MIYGNRIRLRAPKRDDMYLFTTWLNDPEVSKYISIILPFSIEEEESWFDAMLKRPKEEHTLVIEVRQSEDDQEEVWQPIGNIGFHTVDWRVRSAELGIVIGENAYWDQGYGSEALRLMLRHGFEMLNLQRIFLRVFESNPRAIRSFEKVGFVHEGRMRRAQYAGGKYFDVLFMSILHEEWLEIIKKD
jgi:RimJ/RimL family protein N-acetyltransferase